jgi:hypothetical protein
MRFEKRFLNDTYVCTGWLWSLVPQEIAWLQAADFRVVAGWGGESSQDLGCTA